MIDERALAEEIRSLRVSITGLRPGKGILHWYAKYYKRSVLKIIDEQPRIYEWIPVIGGGSLYPTVGEEVLVTTWCGEVLVGTWWGKRWGTAYRHSEEVVAWMPKPKGYVM